MFDIIYKIWKTGIATHKLPFEDAPHRYRGKINIQPDQCNCCETCIKECPAGAIKLFNKNNDCQLAVAYDKCIFCGICTEVCKSQALIMTNDYHLSTKNKRDLLQVVRISQ